MKNKMRIAKGNALVQEKHVGRNMRQKGEKLKRNEKIRESIYKRLVCLVKQNMEKNQRIIRKRTHNFEN